jgi:hypothetical protein
MLNAQFSTIGAMSHTRLSLIPLQILILAACAQAAADRAPLTGMSKTLTVRGEYNAVALDQVDGMSIRDGRLALRGTSATTMVDLPAAADPAQANRGWALVTETTLGDHRSVTFTHETTLDDFTLELPASDAPLRYGSLGGRNGDDVLVFAWGANSRSYWGWVTVVRLTRP